MLAQEHPHSVDTARLEAYFNVGSQPTGSRPIGMEVETSFLDEKGNPITIEQSQRIFKTLLNAGWTLTQTKGNLVSVIENGRGDKFLYEVGRQNLELSTAAKGIQAIVPHCRSILEELYAAAKKHGAYPSFEPIIDTDEDLLIIPDERDAIWDQLDGREALKLIALMSAVQFTIEVPADKAIGCLNSLGKSISSYLASYPQDALWRKYITTSNANYRADRYGGPLEFDSLSDYCQQLAKHHVVQGPQLVPYASVADLDIPLYLRSIWWYFRLRRYGDRLCIEVRPLSRRKDTHLQGQLNFVLSTLSL